MNYWIKRYAISVCEELGNPKIIEITITELQSQQNSYTASKACRNLRKNLREIQFSKGIVRCIIKVAKEGDIFEYNGSDTSRGFRAFKITPIYGR